MTLINHRLANLMVKCRIVCKTMGYDYMDGAKFETVSQWEDASGLDFWHKYHHNKVRWKSAKGQLLYLPKHEAVSTLDANGREVISVLPSMTLEEKNNLLMQDFYDHCTDENGVEEAVITNIECYKKPQMVQQCRDCKAGLALQPNETKCHVLDVCQC